MTWADRKRCSGCGRPMFRRRKFSRWGGTRDMPAKVLCWFCHQEGLRLDDAGRLVRAA